MQRLKNGVFFQWFMGVWEVATTASQLFCEGHVSVGRGNCQPPLGVCSGLCDSVGPQVSHRGSMGKAIHLRTAQGIVGLCE